jgi:aldehyde:ferredoxin oxidoreductase
MFVGGIMRLTTRREKLMRGHLHIDLCRHSVRRVALHGDEVAEAGRYLIAKTLVEGGLARVDALSPENPLIFSAGPFAGTTLSNGNRISVGCKSPLTGGIKEANSGGSFAFALGQLLLAGLTLHGKSDGWTLIHIARDGSVSFDSAAALVGKSNFEAATLLRQAYGEKTSLALCGPVGEYQGLMAGVTFTDGEGRPGRLAARGGVGTVMGSKKVKAIVVDMDKVPALHDRQKYVESTRTYAAKLLEQPAVKGFHDYGTAGMADFLDMKAGLIVRNFTAGRQVDRKLEPFKLGGDYIRERTLARHGHPSHACMPGCVIQCSNIYVDESGKELVSPLEYESLGLLGTNCGLTDPDDVARLNYIANDLGVDSIEAGATIGMLMGAGFAEFGDIDFILAALEDVRCGNERGRILAQGTARAAEHFNINRVPVIKKQAISAYDPRVVEVTGASMMTSAQGADHTSGNLPVLDTTEKSVREVVAASYTAQVNAAVADSFGLCLFGRSATDANHELLANAINQCHGTHVETSFLNSIARETLVLEHEFNEVAGFLPTDDQLPAFFYEEPLPPSNRIARLHAEEVNRLMTGLVKRRGDECS